jgi:hypothetical protein
MFASTPAISSDMLPELSIVMMMSTGWEITVGVALAAAHALASVTGAADPLLELPRPRVTPDPKPPLEALLPGVAPVLVPPPNAEGGEDAAHATIEAHATVAAPRPDQAFRPADLTLSTDRRSVVPIVKAQCEGEPPRSRARVVIPA